MILFQSSPEELSFDIVFNSDQWLGSKLFITCLCLEIVNELSSLIKIASQYSLTFMIRLSIAGVLQLKLLCEIKFNINFLHRLYTILLHCKI